MKKILIVGAGMSGATIARVLAETEKYYVDVIDKRPHLGGNCFDYLNDGIRIHKYGPHLFHTNSDKVIEFLSRFTEWIPYEHKVKALLANGKYVPIPINKETFEVVGEENLIETLIRPYSEKMWAMKLEDIDMNIINRLPYRHDNEDRYFPNDKFQALPKKGYTKMFENILNHRNIFVFTDTPFIREIEEDYDHIFYSGPIDAYYNFKYGRLDYRSIKFHTMTIPFPSMLPTTTVNFTHRAPYTRVTEWKKLPNSGSNRDKTIVTFEEPCDYKDNNDERYYPVKDINQDNQRLYLNYAKIPNNNTTFIGRLGGYVYLNMDQVVANSLSVAAKFMEKADES